MSKFFEHTSEGVLKLFALGVLALAYMVIGMVLSAPYTYLSGWDSESFWKGAVILPMAVPALYLMFFVGQTLKPEHYYYQSVRKRIQQNHFFWIMVAYFFLPAICNGASLLLGMAGLKNAASIVFENRYAAFVAVPLASLIPILAYGGIRSMLERKNGRNNDGNGSPPITRKASRQVPKPSDSFPPASMFALA